MMDKMDKIQEFLVKMGAEEKLHPGKVSSSRVVAYAFALTVVAVTIMMSATGTTDHLLVAEVIAGTLTALGLRSKAGNPPS